MNTVLRQYIWLLVCCCSISTVAAQQKDTARVRSLDAVIVTADRTIKEVIPVQTLNGAALQRLSVHSVADAIRYFSGVQVKDYGGVGGLKTVNIRSLGSQHVGVFYDGIELGNAQNGTVDLGRFSLDNMVSISLYNGQKSAIFQTAKDLASAGAVYMTTRIPSFTEGKRNNFKATIKGGSFGTINPSLLWEHRLNEQLTTSFNAEYLYTNGQYRFSYVKKDGYDTTEVRKNGDVYTLRLEGGLYGRITGGEWKAKVYWYNSERGYPGAAVREEPGRFKHQDRQWDNNVFVQASMRKQFSQRYSLQLNSKYAYDYLHYLSDPRLDVTTLYVNNHYRQQEVYFSAAHLITLLPGWSVNAATDFLFNTLRADLVDFVYPRRYTTLGALATSLQLKRLTVQVSLLGTFVQETTKVANSAAGSKHEYTPSLIISWQPWKQPDIHLRAFYKRIFRMPTLNDLYYTFIGNKYLVPEYTTQYNAGVTFARDFPHSLLRRVEAQADAYFNQVKNKIVAMPTSNQFRWTMLNLGYTEIRGLDVAVQTNWQLSPAVLLNARLSYTYQKAQDFTDRASPYYGGQLPYIPWHSGSLVLNPTWQSWHLHYSFIYTGERYEAVANIPENYSRPWYTHDVALTKNMTHKKKTVRLTAEVNNLLNQHYEVVQWYPMPGINYKLIAGITL
ncbi:TonB-dependent receptor [Pseudoflavitalea sp. X16]|uniref:TonB-dependent receptor n=1 Tax=Paraflavitalea devenefica TaxID=2716334 RepID=UPI0014226B0E|nr:TonB-dependent receptor [Paraflavitalea devenefica]NII26313.1 TonB-dependent receptor [Paraflavitalea devenefica]